MSGAVEIPAWAAEGHWLLTSAAAKVDLTRRLRQALHRVGKKLFTCDRSPWSPALYESDGSFLSLGSEESGFLDDLVAQCQARDVRVILPTRDGDLPALLRHREALWQHRVWVLAAPLESVHLCQDKRRLHALALAEGLPVLPLLTAVEPGQLPVFVRPRQGSAGVDSRRIENWADWQCWQQQQTLADWLVQPAVDWPEYTIDALFAADGTPVQWVSRRRLRVSGGESQVSQVVAVPALDELLRATARVVPLFGPVTVQAFVDPEGRPWLIEINPRVGGASALSMQAGLDTPQRLVALVQGNTREFEEPRPIRHGLMLLRYRVDRYLEPHELLGDSSRA